MYKNIFYLGALLLMGCKTVPSSLGSTENHEQQVPSMDGKVFASARLDARSGSVARGQAWFAEVNDGIQVAIFVSGVNPGAHGIHIHEKGDCSASDASSAGAHLNPSSHEHGPPQPKLFHAGDLGNIIIDDKGFGVLNLSIPAENLDPNFSWTTIIGKSIVLHDKPDDMHSQPSGNSGARISCGLIAKQN